MLTIAKLFGKSPFAPLQTHMNKVAGCMDKLRKIFEVLSKQDVEKIEKLASELSNLEHEANLTKNDIRNHLPKSLFLPIDHGQFLEILSIQDNIADKAEEISMLLTLRGEEIGKDLKTDIPSLFKKNTEVFISTKQIVEEIDELLESSFGGLEAEKVKSMIEVTAFKKYEAEKLKRAQMKELFAVGDSLPAPLFYLWLKLIEEIGEISHLSERLANRIRMILELK